MTYKAYCGERGIRTPGGVTLNSFQDCRIRPLCHFSNSGGKYKTLFLFIKTLSVFNFKKKPSKKRKNLYFQYFFFLQNKLLFHFELLYLQLLQCFEDFL